MNDDDALTRLAGEGQEAVVAAGPTMTTDKTATKRPTPQEQSLEEYEEDIDRVIAEATEEAVQQALQIAESMPIEPEEEDYTREDYERELEFGQLEAAREEHFEMLKRTDSEQPKYPPFEYLVDGLLPLNEVHVIAGETGAGKSTWLFDNFINVWQREKPVLGRKSHWLPYVILVNDRSKAGMIRMLQRLHLHPKQFPIVSTIEGGKITLVKKIEAFHDANPDLKVVFIEGLHVGQKEGNDYGQSSEAMQELNALCQKRNLTIVATTHISKANAQLGAADRTSIIGSNATPGMCETVFVLNKQKKGGRVKLTVHPRNERAFTQLYKWTEDGKLFEAEDAEDQDRFVTYLNQLPTDTFKTEDVVHFYDKHFKVGRDTAQKEIKRAIAAKWIEPCVDERTGKVKKGRYRTVKIQWGDEEDSTPSAE